MAVKKSDLYSSLWASCDELRGGMDASQYKDYVLFMLFIKYVSDKYGDSDDFEPPIRIPNGASFKDMVALKGNPEIGDRINKQVIQPLVDENMMLARTDFPDFDDPNKLGEGSDKVDRLERLIAIFQNPNLDFSGNRAENDDILGDAYEYLMRHFATESGKSKGQFYTPSEVSRVIAKVIGISPKNTIGSTTAYDPTCGSGSLLLKVAAEAGKQITLEGQEKDVTTAGLARMNMILHDFPTAKIVSGNTLTQPKFLENERLRTYDYVVANPPFSDKAWSTGFELADGGIKDKYKRFSFGTPPAKQGDYAYLLHIIRSMKSTGKAACILPLGALGRSNAEAVIREQLVQSGYLQGIIALPPNLFFGTPIPASIVVLDKENAVARRGVKMIDASKGFARDGSKNRLREQDVHKIVDAFTNSSDTRNYSRFVSYDEIAGSTNAYNLNPKRYIDSTEPDDLHDIMAHLQGGLPARDIEALAPYWAVMPGLRDALFAPGDRPKYHQMRLAQSEVKPAILNHAEFLAFTKTAKQILDGWCTRTTPKLLAFGPNSHPKDLIADVSEDLLHAFRAAPLINSYDVYQHLMDFWAAAMQDDCYLISADGWVKGAQPREIKQIKVKDKLVWPEAHDYLVGRRRFKSDLIPAALMIAAFFAPEQAAIDALDAQIAELEQHLANKLEEGAGEDGLLAEVIEGDGDKAKITAKAIKARMKEIGCDADTAEEHAALKDYLALIDGLARDRAKRKAAAVKLCQLVHDKYGELTEDEVKDLAVNAKWLERLRKDTLREVERVSQTLSSRVCQLAQRYATPLGEVAKTHEELSKKIEEHLSSMFSNQPRFSDDWIEISLPDAVAIQNGQVDPKSEPYRSMPLVGPEHIETATGKLFDVPSAEIQGAISGKYEFERGDLIYGKINPHLKKVTLAPFDGICSADLYPMRPKQGQAARFLLSVLLSKQFSDFAISLSARSGIPKINRSELAGFSFMAPPSFEEQDAISSVLDDLDSELLALEKMTQKTQMLKQAIEQELLNARTRLPVSETEHD